MKPEFPGLVLAELAAARADHPPLHSLHEALAVIREEYAEFEAMVFMRAAEREPQYVLEELVQIAAMCQRAAEDLALVGKLSDAVFQRPANPGRKETTMGKLVITRKPGQTFSIDRGRIIVSVVGVRRRAVQLAIEAPRDVEIARDDIAENTERRQS